MTTRRALFALAAAGCATPGAAAPPATPFAIETPAGSPLRPLGGLVLNRAVIGFGGLSGLHLGPDLRITAVSDLAHWLTARLVLADGRPAGLAELRTGPLRDGSGHPLPRGFAGDAESLAPRPGGGWLVGFERWHRIRAYPRIDGPALDVAAPADLAEAPNNGGLESLTVLADGRWLAIAEAQRPAGRNIGYRAWLGRPGAWLSLGYRAEPGLAPVDCCALPDGGALVLERTFSLLGGFRGRLARLPPAALAEATATTMLMGEELLALGPPLPPENYEGVSAALVDGRLLVALIADDNQSPFQRSLLLLFALEL